MKRALAIVGAAVLLIAWWWWPHRPPPTDGQVMREVVELIDRDRDGRISRVEWSEFRGQPQWFMEFDRDQDGFLDVGELTELFRSKSPMPRGDAHAKD